ncbi:hypothetical protein [Chitinophaga vietnamensis]|uniref:hypothetical protein n=1 Tax=Chitinophaga vietnamensis TaxID=2593957 RepID=UPI00117755E9|nr:hypothetical protein [Chitinophaga vietnamensis]
MRIQRFYILLILLFSFAACKKVEHYDNFLHTVYSVINSGFLYRTDGSFFYYQYPYADKTMVAGDTLHIAGILGGKGARKEVHIGDSVVTLFAETQYRIYNVVAKDTIWSDVDYFSCRIPQGITGNNVTVNVKVNGVSVTAPPLKILQYTNIPSATDTTLVVEKVTEWLPADLTLYGGVSKALWESGFVTNTGNVWFYNQPEGIVKVGAGIAKKILSTGAQVRPVKGTPFKILGIVAFTVDIDETVVYFTAATTEESPDNAQYYITRFCRMDPASGSIEVLNRSRFLKLRSQYGRAADLTTTLYDPGVNYLPAEGSLADARIVPGDLRIALDGTLYARNMAYLTTPFPKSPLAGNPKFPQFSDPAFYATRDSVNAWMWFGLGGGYIRSGVNNFIRIRNGEVKSLAKSNSSWPVPALAIFSYLNQQMSPDGKYLYQLNARDRTLTIISTDDFEREQQGTPGKFEFSFSSMDTSAATGLHVPTIVPNEDRLANGYVLSNGDGVFFPSEFGGLSLMGINFAKHNAYAYAGTEKGLILPISENGLVPQQRNTTGLARWVNFSPVLQKNSRRSFIGFDRKNSLYFVCINQNANGTGYLPLEIYRIKKP